MILDSTYVFDLMAEDRGAFEKGVEIVERGELQWLPVPVVAETFYGAATERSDTTKFEIRNRLLGYPRIDLNEELSRAAGQLLASADDDSGEDSGVGWNDAHIAAIANVLDQPVLTDNVADFERLGVEVETY
ncbi:PIN domain-containing protein [Halorussus salilacus]|uniref:PIN domain-containing protein n=1 Tax=Halorussus salilacus TaxID=2953750 RepID=UPI00209D8041|nr:PIN domain-containing protein [Halorussus salilacus]USZ68472.1 PIN domain-containing protein [Halorussus salilacus]